MKKSTGFLMGLGTGMVAGAIAAGMLTDCKPMKTPVGRSIRKVGNAVDGAVDHLYSDLR